VDAGRSVAHPRPPPARTNGCRAGGARGLRRGRPGAARGRARRRAHGGDAGAAARTAEGFECLDHDGRRLATLSARELAAISTLAVSKTRAAADAEQRARGGVLALDAREFQALLERLARIGLVAHPDSEGHKGREDHFMRAVVANQWMYRAVTDDRLQATFNEPRAATDRRVTVVPFDCWNEPIPLALGMLIAHAQAVDGGRLLQHYEFLPQTKFPEQQDRILDRGPAVLLFSNYLWSHVENLRTSERAKRLSPGSVTIHGGPTRRSTRATSSVTSAPIRTSTSPCAARARSRSPRSSAPSPGGSTAGRSICRR
jgi:hypothetical protein